MHSFTIEELIKSVPYSVRFELLKKQLTDVYKKESDLKRMICNLNEIDENEFSFTKDSIKIIVIENYNFYHKNIQEMTDKFLKTIATADLPDQMLISLYQWEKEERKKMGLEDNLFNLFDLHIKNSSSYKVLNDEINSRMKI